jgi:hypothetical protein
MLSRPQGHSAAGRITSTEKFNVLVRNRIRDLPACSICLNQLRYRVSPSWKTVIIIINSRQKLKSNTVCLGLCGDATLRKVYNYVTLEMKRQHLSIEPYRGQ